MRRSLTLIAVLGSMLLLEGCLYRRLTQTYHQLCDASPRIALQASGDGRVLVFDEPTLLDTDVACLVGTAPTTTAATLEGKRWRYLASPLGSDGSTDYTILLELRFARVEGGYRLSRATLPVQLEQLLSPHLVDQSIAAACNGELDLIRRIARVDLSGIDRSWLPDRVSVIELFGPPNAPADATGALTWRYCVGRCGGGNGRGQLSEIRVVFDPSGRIEQVSLDYLQSSALANFAEGSGLVAFSGSIAGIVMNCGL
jgi:hypothetical protein